MVGATHMSCTVQTLQMCHSTPPPKLPWVGTTSISFAQIGKLKLQEVEHPPLDHT